MKTSKRVIGCSALGMVLALAACASNKPAQGDVPTAPTAAAAPVQAAAGAAPAGASSATPAADDWAAAGAAGAGGAAGASGVVAPESAPKHPSKLIMATIHGKSGSKLTGQATFSDKGGNGVKVFIEISGAKPGEHGTHIHEYANCATPDGSSAGGHFNPEGHQHGLPDKEARHLGDLGNIVVDKDGKGTLEIVVSGANLKDTDPHSFIGRGLIIHDKKDDGGQPVGNAGNRVGCAEIK